jgi:hypothetical protein
MEENGCDLTYLEEVRTTENVSQDIWQWYRDLKLAPPEYNSIALLLYKPVLSFLFLPPPPSTHTRK